MASPSPHRDTRPPGPDELEQRQEVDGEVDPYADIVDEHGAPLDADALEQRLREDGSYEPGVFDRTSGEPLTADMIEQRQSVEFDDEDRPDL